MKDYMNLLNEAKYMMSRSGLIFGGTTGYLRWTTGLLSLVKYHVERDSEISCADQYSNR